MSLFNGMLALADGALLQEEVTIGILGGSVLAGLLGWTILRFAPSQIPARSEQRRA